ncbi:MAG: tRNA pseudouridine(55) synthase TruB [Treponema sp.]
MNLNDKSAAGKIVLLAKRPGLTSFASLYAVKRAFRTSKVGHTGTLDSFAEGLLVVCTGSLTRLAGRITQFDKTYEAVIRFGEETDTLECTGSVVKTAPLPSKSDFEKAVSRFTGKLMQSPPAFSALHVDGARSSDLARQGMSVELPLRPVTVYESKILEIAEDTVGAVSAARVLFTVSKGTYIRSLARDIAAECKSAAHLAGLRRTKVGEFRLEDAAGFCALNSFTIESALENAERLKNAADGLEKRGGGKKDEYSADLISDIREKSLPMTENLAAVCGFDCVLLRRTAETSFKNGAKLAGKMFASPLERVKTGYAAVFTEAKNFVGLIEKTPDGKLKYGFVEHSFL